jgi:PucR family transcriptional regulator, proline-responsive transcriptional activator
MAQNGSITSLGGDVSMFLEDFLGQSGWGYSVVSNRDIHGLSISTVGLGMDYLLCNHEDNSALLSGYAEIVLLSTFVDHIKSAIPLLLPEVFLILPGTVQTAAFEEVEALKHLLPDCTIIIIDSDIQPEKLYFTCIELIHQDNNCREQLISHHYLHLADLLSQDADVSEIESYAYKVLGNPMIITDESYKMMTYSKSNNVDDFIWSTIVNNTYCPSQIVKMTDHNHFWERLKKNRHPLFVDSDDFSPFTRRAVAVIKAGMKIKGYIALVEVNKKISARDLDVLQMVAEIIGMKFKEQDAVLKAIGLMESELISDLLDGKMNNERMARNRVRSVGWKIEQTYFVLCVQSKQKMRMLGSIVTKLRDRLLAHYPFCVDILQGEFAFFIIGFEVTDEAPFHHMKSIEKIMVENKTIGYVGMAFHTLTEVSKSYSQAKSTVQTTQLLSESLNKPLYLYSEMVVYDLLVKTNQLRGYDTFTCPSLATLVKIDQEDGTEYIQTLRYFFKNNQNSADTAKAMFLHRNTINYRLNKIRYVIEDDFDNPAVRLHMNLALMLLDLGIIHS